MASHLSNIKDKTGEDCQAATSSKLMIMQIDQAD